MYSYHEKSHVAEIPFTFFLLVTQPRYKESGRSSFKTAVKVAIKIDHNSMCVNLSFFKSFTSITLIERHNNVCQIGTNSFFPPLKKGKVKTVAESSINISAMKRTSPAVCTKKDQR